MRQRGIDGNEQVHLLGGESRIGEVIQVRREIGGQGHLAERHARGVLLQIE